MAKNQFQMHILWFFFHADIKMTRKRPWNLYKYKNSLLKTYFSLIIEYGMYLKCLQKRVNLAALLVQNKPSAPIRRVENKVEFLERQRHSEKRSFALFTKRKLSILLNFLFPVVSFIGVFSILKCKTLVLKTTTWWKRASHSFDRWHLLRCQIRFFPRPLKWLTWPLEVCGVYWFSLRIFSQTSLQLEIFSPRYNGVRFCWALYVMSDIFFSAGYFFPRNLFACFFPKSVCRTFFLKSPIIPSKVKWSATKIHQTFGQLTDSDLSIISKGFWNNRGQYSLGERGGIHFYFPIPGGSVRTDKRWRHTQNVSVVRSAYFNNWLPCIKQVQASVNPKLFFPYFL